MRAELVTAVKNHIVVPRVMTPFSFVVGYQYTASIFRVFSLTTLRHNSEDHNMET
jgi:hypothetical protein